MSDLRIDAMSKAFEGHPALQDVSIEARDGELLTLLGPSGCGKSTTLWSIAGLHSPDAGTITIGDDVVFDAEQRIDVAPERRSCGVVFQSYAVWPHLTVAENVAYPLKLRRIRRPERDARVAEVLELVELGELAARYPHQLSGGQQQRVALARALAVPPRLLLLDEPFSNLDAKLRERARVWLRHLQQELGVTTIFVTHDQDEALSMSDRIVVMDHGVVHQVGTPEEVYEQPADLFVADFVGTTNLLDATAGRRCDGGLEVRVPGLDGVVHATPVGEVADGPVTLAVRPERIGLCPPADDGGATRVPVLDRAYLGDHLRYRVQLGDAVVTVQTTRAIPVEDHVGIVIHPGDARAFPREER